MRIAQGSSEGEHRALGGRLPPLGTQQLAWQAMKRLTFAASDLSLLRLIWRKAKGRSHQEGSVVS